MTQEIEHHNPAAGERMVRSHPAETIDHVMQMLFACSLTLFRASRTTEQNKDELILSAIQAVDESIRVLRGTAAALV